MDHIKDLWWIALAGLSGAFTSVSLQKDKRGGLEVFVFIVSGMLTSAFIAPLIIKWSGLEGVEAFSAIGFLTGACWNTVINRGADWFNSTKVGGGK